VKAPPPPFLINNNSFMYYALFGMSSRNYHKGQRRDYIRRGLRENKVDGGLMIVFRRLLRTSESNTETYRGIHYNI